MEPERLSGPELAPTKFERGHSLVKVGSTGSMPGSRKGTPSSPEFLYNPECSVNGPIPLQMESFDSLPGRSTNSPTLAPLRTPLPLRRQLNPEPFARKGTRGFFYHRLLGDSNTWS